MNEEKYKETVEAMKLMIKTLPESFKSGDELIIVSIGVAQDLSDYNAHFTGQHKLMMKGDRFKFMGYNCKVV